MMSFEYLIYLFGLWVYQVSVLYTMQTILPLLKDRLLISRICKQYFLLTFMLFLIGTLFQLNIIIMSLIILVIHMNILSFVNMPFYMIIPVLSVTHPLHMILFSQIGVFIYLSRGMNLPFLQLVKFYLILIILCFPFLIRI